MKEKIRTDLLQKSMKMEDLERRHKEYQEKDKNAGFVVIKDENGKEKQVRIRYNDSEGYSLTLWARGVKKISNIKRLKEATHLETLGISGSNITEIEGLDTLTNLRRLYISGGFTEIKGLDSLKNLHKLNIYSKKITEIRGLDNLKGLTWLSLCGNKIIEIKGLENLENLEILDLAGNQIAEIKGLENLMNLIDLDLSNNRITEIKGLKNLKNLKCLYLADNKITEIKGLWGLRNLSHLDLQGNPSGDLYNYEDDYSLFDVLTGRN